MKFNNLLSATLFAGLFTMVSCSQEELGGQPQNDGKNYLQITVTDDGVFGDSQTRAVEDGYKTTFEAGDMIGVYGLKSGSMVVENHKFTFKEDGTWESNGRGIEFIEEDMEEMKFYAYYPYQPQGVKFNSKAGLQGDPFAETVSGWEIGTDFDENYTNYDLMTSGIAEITSTGALGVINFKLKHRMSIAAIELPGKVYNFTNTDPEVEPYKLPAVPGKFIVHQGEEKIVKPYYDKKNDLYRILVKPSIGYKVSGTYTLEKRMDFESNTVTGQEGKARRFKLKGSIVTEHNLQVGDYYCTDGSIVAVGDEEPVPNNAVGIIVYVGNPKPSVTSGYGEPLDILYNEHPSCNHGLVIALKNAVVGGVEKVRFGNSSKIHFGGWLASNDEWGGKLIGNATNTSIPGFMGYNNTKIMEIATKNEMPEAEACLEAWKYTEEYRNSVLVPSVSTPWFLPSTTEFDEVQKTLTAIINPKLEAAGGQTLVNIKDDHYWTTTERSSNMSMQYAYDVAKGKCDLYQRNRGGSGFPGYFRMMLAF